MSNTTYKRGDTVPLKANLPTDLSEASVKFQLSSERGGDAIIDTNAVVENASEGKVAYQWKDGETDRVGSYYIEWKVVYSDGGIRTFPRDGYDEIFFIDNI